MARKTSAIPIPEPKSRRLKKKLLSFAGVWSDLDADRLIHAVFKARHEAPPSRRAGAQ